MNMNPHPDWNAPMRWRQVRRPEPHGNPLPRWIRWLAAVLIFGGLAVLEYQDAQVEQVIQQARK